MALEERAIVDGRPTALAEARLALTDDGAVRGDGAFETVGVWDGRPFRLERHLDRLEASLTALLLPAPDRDAIAADVTALLEGVAEDAMLRLYVTAGGTRAALLAPQPHGHARAHLVVQPAPWIRRRGTTPLAGAKSMSYAANMTATRMAQRAGAGDALLVSDEGWVLEGPTFAVLWIAGEILCAPTVELGIVDSVSRQALLDVAAEAGTPVREGRWPVDDLLAADEVVAVSAPRALVGVRRIGDVRFDGPTPATDRLAAALDRLRRGMP